MLNPSKKYDLCIAVLVCGFFVAAFVMPETVPAQCPPNAPYSPEVNQLLDSCNNWVCDVSYDPAQGYLPEDHPVYPWEASYESGTIVEILNDKLVITGPGTPDPLPEAAFYFRQEPAMVAPATSIYIIQVQYRVRELFENTNTQDETLAIMGASDPDRGVMSALRYQDNQRVVVIGEGDYTPNPEYVMAWDWEVDTVYTMVVHRGHQVYLFVDGQPMMSRPYDDLEPDPPTLQGVFAFTSGNVEAEYTYVRYCACQPALTYKGEDVDDSAVIPELQGPNEKLVVENLRDEPDPFHPPLEEAQLLMDINPLNLPGLPSGQFQFVARITWTIEDYQTQQQLTPLVEEVPLEGLQTVEGMISWGGDDDELPVPDGLYVYKAKIQLIRTRINDGRTIVFDEVESPWRLLEKASP
jgi:hypothetical protein